MMIALFADIFLNVLLKRKVLEGAVCKSTDKTAKKSLEFLLHITELLKVYRMKIFSMKLFYFFYFLLISVLTVYTICVDGWGYN